MNKLPEGIPVLKLELINVSLLPGDDKDLFQKFQSIYNDGKPHYEANKQSLVAVDTVEKFYSVFKPFVDGLTPKA